MTPPSSRLVVCALAAALALAGCQKKAEPAAPAPAPAAARADDSMSLGDPAAKVRMVNQDKPLSKAIELLEKNPTQAQLLAAAPAAVRK